MPRRCKVLAPLALLVVLATSSHAAPPWAHSGARISSALERVLRDEIAHGRVLPPELMRRWGLDQPELDPALAAAVARPEATHAVTSQALATDMRLNDKSADATCGACGFRPLGQAETTIAAWGNFLLAGWNDGKGFCTGGPIQGWAWSVNGGGTWTDGGPLPSPIAGGRFRGDPVHAVNRRTGDFYVAGLYEDPLNGANSGVALIRGHFTGGTFAIDLNHRIAVGGPNFLDKDWLAVDSLSGNVYVTYTQFDVSNRIILIRSTDGGVTWDPAVQINDPGSDGAVQGSRPVVGPDGLLYVVWYEYGYPLSHVRIRRSNNFGVSFGPVATVADFYENGLSGAPGFRRGEGVSLPSVAVDASTGPHRGRAYVAWDEAVNFYDAPFPVSPTVVNEVEVNDNPSHPTAFVMGNTLRGATTSTADVDYWSFTGTHGQTLLIAADSVVANSSFDLRIMCTSDTSALENYRFLAFDRAGFPAVVFTLPADGTYLVRLSTTSSTVGGYHLRTTWDTPSPGERARDHRDRFASHSDDGVTWSTPKRLNDDPPGFDGVYPELTADGSGAVHAFWHDFRDDGACGAMSYEYMTSSGDGGDTWGANRRLSDAQSFWSVNSCGSANQGDYQGITSQGNSVYPCWTDSRLGDPDAFVEADLFQLSAGCEVSRAVAGGSTTDLRFTIVNPGNVQAAYAWKVTDDEGWIEARSGLSAPLPAGSSSDVTAPLHAPGDCLPAAIDTVRFTVSDPTIPGRSVVCLTPVTCSATSGVVAGMRGLALEPPQPNPSASGVRVTFTLPTGMRVRLTVHAASGARIRTLAAAPFDVGRHALAWDGRDDAGRRAPAGAYFLRLEGEGRTLTRPVTLVR